MMRWLLGFSGLILAPLLLAAWLHGAQASQHWSRMRWDPTGLAPDPASHPEAMVQVYAARALGWKGAVAVHSWIALKRPDADSWERFDVVGWGVGQGRSAVRRNLRPVDGYWAGARPTVVAELRGPEAAAAIPAIDAAIADYPWNDRYVMWPGPNSNSFVAWVTRRVPQLGVELPPTAIGKDFTGLRILGRASSGGGLQLSLGGILGLTVAPAEGLEVNLLGFVFGVDPGELAIKLPGLGRLGPELAPPASAGHGSPPG